MEEHTNLFSPTETLVKNGTKAHVKTKRNIFFFASFAFLLRPDDLSLWRYREYAYVYLTEAIPEMRIFDLSPFVL